MVSEISNQTLEQRIMENDEYCRAAQYLKEVGPERFEQILSKKAAEGSKIAACAEKGRPVTRCEKCDSASMCDILACGYFDAKINIKTIMDTVTKSTAEDVLKAAKFRWANGLRQDKFMRILCNYDLITDFLTIDKLYGHLMYEFQIESIIAEYKSLREECIEF